MDKVMCKKMFRFLSLVILGMSLSGCAFWHQPDYRNIPGNEALSPGEEITVGAGQNVYTIAKKYNVSMRDIIALNNLKSPFVIKSGQTLVLPVRDGQDPRTPQAAPLSMIEKAPLEPISTSVSSAPLSDATPTPAPSSVSSKNGIAATELDAPPPASNAPIATTVVDGLSASESGMGSSSAAPAGDFSASPPLQGTILSGFGPKADGLSNDGINISAPKGSPVVAAAGGMVVYAGNEMKGFGNLVLIRHEDGWVTAYAHLDRMLVSKDTIVAVGDQIGTVGATGGVSSPQLHFETRYNGTPVDPQTVLKKNG